MFFFGAPPQIKEREKCYEVTSFHLINSCIPGISAGCCPAVLKSCRVDLYKRFADTHQISSSLLRIDFNDTIN